MNDASSQGHRGALDYAGGVTLTTDWYLLVCSVGTYVVT